MRMVVSNKEKIGGFKRVTKFKKYQINNNKVYIVQGNEVMDRNYNSIDYVQKTFTLVIA